MNGEKASASLVERVPPQLWFMGSAVFHYLGPSFAVLLFARVPVGGVAWLRIVSAAVLFAAWRRPWRSFFRADGATQRLTISLGLIFAVMNYTFYMAISRLPLGTVAAIEFVGPIVLALTGSRTRRNLLALALAVAGVYLLTEVHVGETLAPSDGLLPTPVCSPSTSSWLMPSRAPIPRSAHSTVSQRP